MPIRIASTFLVPALLTLPPYVLAQGTQLDGTWAGQTTCPMGPMSCAVSVEGLRGIVEYKFGSEPIRRFPVAVRISGGWQGEWVHFEMPGLSPNNYQAFGDISGLLSPDARSKLMRGPQLGDCNEFQLVRTHSQQLDQQLPHD